MSTDEALPFSSEEVQWQAYIETRVNSAVAQALAQVASTSPAPTRIKPVQPATFHGKPNENVRQWIFAVELWFSAGNVINDADRIILAVSLLRDAALVWWRSIYELAEKPATWEEFKYAAVNAFEPVNPAESARDRLASLRQSGSVRTYAYLFRSIAMSIPGITDDEKKDRFIRGLKVCHHERGETEMPGDF